jgi:DNA polymerase I
MQIVLRTGIALRQGTFSAVIAPERSIIRALNGNPELERFLFLFVCGNYSRLVSHISRPSPHFEVRRPFTADQLLAVIKDAGHTIIFIEHDATLFDSADRLIGPVGSALREAGREALLVLYAPVMDRSFAALANHADRLIEVVNAGEPDPYPRAARMQPRRTGSPRIPSQTTLEVL